MTWSEVFPHRQHPAKNSELMKMNNLADPQENTLSFEGIGVEVIEKGLMAEMLLYKTHLLFRFNDVNVEKAESLEAVFLGRLLLGFFQKGKRKGL